MRNYFKFLLVSPLLSVVPLVSACGVDTSIPGASAPVRPSASPRVNVNNIPIEKNSPSQNPQDPAPEPRDSNSQAPVLVNSSVLNVKVTGFKTADGQLCYSLFDSANREYFGREDAPPSTVLRAACIPVNQEENILSITDLPKGTYAIALFHDKNSNAVLDKNGIIPVERFGFSNNPAIRFGAPSFDDCSFLFEGATIELGIGLKYLIDF